jgi:magnesium transporter
MLTAYAFDGTALTKLPDATSGPAPVWLDLFNPTPEEDHCVEGILGVEVPTRDEMQEIETSSRLYEEGGAFYMTATLLCHADSDKPRTTPVSFILANGRLCTVRYDAPQPFAHFAQRAGKSGDPALAACGGILFGLIDAVVDRIADVLERVGAEIDQIQGQVFSHDISEKGDRAKDYAWIIRSIGREGNLISKIQESLVSLSRMMIFLAEDSARAGIVDGSHKHIDTIIADIRSLGEHAVALDAKVSFLLQASLGLVGLQQNTIVKIFSVLAVVFMPPTLIASLYGMNFKLMPELEWTYGYPFALGLMLASVALTYTVFKWRGWL